MKTHSTLLSLGKLAATFAPFLPRIAGQSTIPSPNLDLSQLGRIAIAGDFDSISLYQYEGQNENSYNTNGSQSLLARYPNGAFQNVASADAYIETMCPFTMMDGTLAGIVVGGNFTSLGGVQTQGVALYNPNTTQITPLPGLSGRVSTVYCDADSATVYVGGSFTGGNSSNAIAWVTGWTNLPFAGFNGPVTSITKAPNGNIVFAGMFDGLGNTTTPSEPNGQVINVGSANITAKSSTSQTGYSDPSNIVCKTGSDDGSGNTWLLADDTAGSWEADFGFGFNPTLLRLYNTQVDGRGTKTFRFTALPINGIMNLTYVDSNGQNQSCTSACPLPQGNETAQDFTFVNVIGMNSFRIDISDWYGSGGGLAGIELFQNDIYAFAIDSFNQPQCDDVSTTGANATATGPWTNTPSGQSTSDYLTAKLTSGKVTADSASVVFMPDIKQSGNYSVTVYTPGCVQDDTCSSRGQVTLEATMTSKGVSVNTTLYQTNDYDKYDQVYYGYVDADDSSFRPSVTLAPVAGQDTPLTIVAQRIRFELLASTGGLNGIFEYNPNEATVNTDFTTSAIDSAGMGLNSMATVNSLAVVDQSLYVAGAFASGDINNVFSVGSDNATSLPSSGLNDAVQTIYQSGSTLYFGGNFTSSGDNSVQDLNAVAVFSVSDNSWQALGAGVNGSVVAIVPFQLNVTSSDLEDVLALTGDFSTVNGFGSNPSFSANGFAIWVLSKKNWLNNLNSTSVSISGELLTYTNVPGSTPLFAGSVSSQDIGSTDTVALTGSGSPTLQSLGVNITASQSTVSGSLSKRAASSQQSVAGAATGYFYDQNGQNVTILGGHFSATATNGSTIHNLLLVNNTDGQVVTGLPSTINAASTILSMDVSGTSLYAGGSVSGTADGNTIDGLLVYDLATGALASTQPPALSGSTVTVNAVAAQPSASTVFVGGSFSSAGSLSCASLCMWDTTNMQWNSPGVGLAGTVSSMIWASDTSLIIAGNLTNAGNATTMVTYDLKKQTFTTFNGASALPGPVTALAAADSGHTQFWAAGIATNNGSAFLDKYDGKTWTAAGGIGEGSSIRGLQVIGLTSNHDSSTLVSSNQVLLITGQINVSDFGNASAVLFNGTTYEPFLLTTSSSNQGSSVSKLFVQNPGNFLSSSKHHIAKGFIVLIGLAIALALIFLLVVAGILMERYRRKREGYVPMQQLRPDQQANLGRIPPERLFGSMNEKDGPPKL